MERLGAEEYRIYLQAYIAGLQGNALPGSIAQHAHAASDVKHVYLVASGLSDGIGKRGPASQSSLLKELAKARAD